MQVDGPDVLEVERRLELPRGQRHMLSARAAGWSEMLRVVVVGRGQHPLSLPGGMSRTLISYLDSMRSGGEKGG